MKKINRVLKYAFLLALVGIYPLSALAGHYTPQTETALAQAAEQGNARAQQASSGLLPVLTTWNRCDVYKSRRSARIGGNRGKVQVDYNCQDVSTRCSAVLSDGKAYISQNCYYAEKKEDQKLYFKSSRLIYADGQAVSLLLSQMSKTPEYVIFALK